MKVLDLENPTNFMFYSKPSSASNLLISPVEPAWPCMKSGHDQVQIFVKTKAIGALFLKTIHAAP